MNIEQGLQNLIHKSIEFAPKLVSAVLVFLAFWIGATLLVGLFKRFEGHSHLHADVVILLRRVVKVALVAVGAVTALGTLGIDVSAMVAGLGLTGFALGFALKDILSNFLSGVLILVYKPFRHSDKIEVTGLQGIVTNIDFRYTTLQTAERMILIPNSTLFTNTISVLKKAEAT